MIWQIREDPPVVSTLLYIIQNNFLHYKALSVSLFDSEDGPGKKTYNIIIVSILIKSHIK